MTIPLLAVRLDTEHDVVLARQRARQIADQLGFDAQDRTRLTTAVSEIARNAAQYAKGGKAEFLLSEADPWQLIVRISDNGPGIPHLKDVLDGRYRSPTGMGMGIVGSRRLLDSFDIQQTRDGGTTVTMGKQFSRRMSPPNREALARLRDELARQRAGDPVSEIQQQNQELLRMLDELRARQTELEQVNQELEETNRGVVALYAELDERADYLQRATEIKSRFLSNMTHEFRTPLNSILSLCRILLQHMDGPLLPEQEKQVRYIETSAEALSELVNDLLDLAKAEAGKLVVRPVEFQVEDLFGTLRGMLRPLLAQNASINLVFEESTDLPQMYTDESKVSQILRNFISNAIKYTEHGEVRVSAESGPGNTVVFAVADTGIGIAEEDHERIFDEFSQIESPLQHKVRGTGLGLPLSRKLAQMLGGSIRVKSELGIGSTFYAMLPADYRGESETALLPMVAREPDPARLPVLVVEDNAEALFIYEKYLDGGGYQVLPARSLKDARNWLQRVEPAAVILDILLEGENTWAFLRDLKEQPRTRQIPVLVVTMVENEQRALSLGASGFHTKPVDQGWLLERLNALARPRSRILIVDDDEISRYLLRNLLAELGHSASESAGGGEALQAVRDMRPEVIFLDLAMPEIDGFEMLERLHHDPELANTPVVIYTSKVLTEEERHALGSAAAIVSKQSANRESALAEIQAALASAGFADNPLEAQHA